jgi:hypothetical protein
MTGSRGFASRRSRQFVWLVGYVSKLMIPFWRIFKKVEFSPWQSVLMPVPLLNVVMFYFWHSLNAKVRVSPLSLGRESRKGRKMEQWMLKDPYISKAICPATIGNIMHRVYNFGAGSNDNGNAQSIANCRDTNRNQNFIYDSLNRITNAYTTGTNWGEAFTTDPWGNLTNVGPHLSKTNHENLNAAPANAKNQLTGFGYDAAGNLTSNGSATYTYDIENRLTATAGYT